MTTPAGREETTTFYHGGKAGLRVGDSLVPSPPHLHDGCPVCVARSEGRALLVGEYRRYLRQLLPRSQKVLDLLKDARDDEEIDPPSERAAVYLTSNILYATWYAARSQGDLYRVVPDGELTHSAEDNFPTWTAPRARIVEVLRRTVKLTRTERRAIEQAWKKADQKASKRKRAASAA